MLTLGEKVGIPYIYNIYRSLVSFNIKMFKIVHILWVCVQRILWTWMKNVYQVYSSLKYLMPCSSVQQTDSQLLQRLTSSALWSVCPRDLQVHYSTC